MKIHLYFAIIFFATACHSQSSPKAQTSPVQPEADLATLKWNLRDAIKMQLPLTFPEKRGEREVKKSYSFDVEQSESGTPMWVIPEKLHDANTDTLFSAGKYRILFENIDISSIQRVLSADESRQCIVIRAKPKTGFLYDPYSNEPDRQVQVIEIGWWERVQDRTLDRVLGYMQGVARKMQEDR